jgi:urocanate hydratase
VDLGSDQTSLHNPYYGGYYPVGLTLEESKKMIREDNTMFRQKIKDSLVRQVKAINTLVEKGMHFWDYGNSFLLEASRSGADVWDKSHEKFKFPSYFENVMDDIFGLGFGPFRWICTSADGQDLRKTDVIAEKVLKSSLESLPEELKSNYEDNLRWIK